MLTLNFNMNMKNLKFIFSTLLAVGLFATVSLMTVSCDDDEPPALTLTSLTAGAIDLNGATSATGVPVGTTITAQFSTEVDASSVSAITLTRDYDHASYAANVTVDGKTVTIDPSDNFSTGTLFILNFGAGLKSKGGKTLTTGIDRNFTSEGTFAAPGAVAQWTFEDNANDVVGTYDPTAAQVVGITYGASHNTASGKAAVFNGTTSIIEVSNGDNLMKTTDFSMSFWVKPTPDPLNPDKGHFVMGLGAFFGFQFEILGGYAGWKMPVGYTFNKSGTIGWAAEDNEFKGDGKNKDNGGWKGFVFTKDLTATGGPATMIKDKWVHIVFVYNATTKHGYYYGNGELMREFDFNLWTDDAGAKTEKAFVTGLKYNGATPDVVNELAFGFVHSRAGTMWDAETWGGYSFASANHLRGSLDDVIVYHRPLTAAEVGLMYNSGKP
jgi:hypothetical protein